MITLRHYQAECAPKVLRYIDKNPTGSPLVALPTGSGKTYCIADLITKLPNDAEILVLSHVKEILEQNYKSLSAYTGEKIGLNSAGLGRREHNRITVAGIQSTYRQAHRYRNAKYIIIDEAHLIQPRAETMYQTLFSNLDNPIHIGFTATPFRLGDGLIYGRDRMFSSLVHDWTTREKFQQLIDEGYLAHLTTKRTALEMDVSGIKLKGGEFNEKDLSAAFDREAVTEAAIKEILAAGRNRKKWLIFAIDISHAEHIAETLIRNGISCAPVHSKMADSGFCRTRTIEGFANGRYQCVVNVNILTTGFDEPGIDLIALLRPTNSPVLHVQSIGRGSRISDGKENCLVLDFAGNTARLGPINDVVVKEKGKGKSGGDPVTKECPDCQSILPPAVKVCPDCGHKFQFEHGLKSTAFINEVVASGRSLWLKVDKVEYSKHSNFGSPSSVKVTYHAEGQKVHEFICIEHKGYAKHIATNWITYRGGVPCHTADELIRQKDIIKTPKRIEVQLKNKYLIIRDAIF